MIRLSRQCKRYAVCPRGSRETVSFILAAALLVFAHGGACHGQGQEAPTSETVAAKADDANSLAKNIQDVVLRLGYPQSTVDDLVRLARGWECEQWRQKLSRARATGSPAHIARAEVEVTKGLYRTIGREIHTCKKAECVKYFDLSNVAKDRKAQCLGYGQLVYVLGSSVGLTIHGIEVLEAAFGTMPPGDLHIACLVSLANGSTIMVDVPASLLSESFVFKQAFVKKDACWELTERGILFGLHRRILVLDERGLASAVYSNRGAAYGSVGDWKQAVACLTKAVELDPRYAMAYAKRGIQHSEAGRHDQSISDLRKAVKLAPTYAVMHHLLGLEYAKTGQRDQAISSLTDAIEFEPRLVDAYAARGALYLEAGQHDKAVHDFNRTLELDPKRAAAYAGRAIANASLGKNDEARQDLEKAVKLNPALKEEAKKTSDRFHLDK